MKAHERNWLDMSDEWLDAAYGTTLHISRHEEVIPLARANGTSHGSGVKGKATLSANEIVQPRRKLKAAA